MGEEALFNAVLFNAVSFLAQGFHSASQIDRVPQDDGGGHQVQSTGPVTLIFKRAVTDFT